MTVVVCILLKLILQERRPFVCMLSFLFVRTLSGRAVDLYVDTFEEVDAQYQNAIQNGAATATSPPTIPKSTSSFRAAEPALIPNNRAVKVITSPTAPQPKQ